MDGIVKIYGLNRKYFEYDEEFGKQVRLLEENNWVVYMVPGEPPRKQWVFLKEKK